MVRREAVDFLGRANPETLKPRMVTVQRQRLRGPGFCQQPTGY